MRRAKAARMCEIAGSPVAGLSVVSSTAISARAASRNSSMEAARGPNGGSSGRPPADTAVPWRSVWMPVTRNGNSARLCRSSRASARAAWPYPMSASFKTPAPQSACSARFRAPISSSATPPGGRAKRQAAARARRAAARSSAPAAAGRSRCSGCRCSAGCALRRRSGRASAPRLPAAPGRSRRSAASDRRCAATARGPRR